MERQINAPPTMLYKTNEKNMVQKNKETNPEILEFIMQ